MPCHCTVNTHNKGEPQIRPHPLQEAGLGNVHKVTRKIASMAGKGNCNRDLFRYVRAPVDVVYVSCPVLADANSEKIVDQMLPMLDPHEYLEWLWCSGRIKVPKDEIRKLGLPTCIYCFWIDRNY